MELLRIEIRVLVHCLADRVQDDHEKDKAIEVRVHHDFQTDLYKDVLVVRLGFVNYVFLWCEQLLQERVLLLEHFTSVLA